jgi:hypothetical protein
MSPIRRTADSPPVRPGSHLSTEFRSARVLSPEIKSARTVITEPKRVNIKDIIALNDVLTNTDGAQLSTLCRDELQALHKTINKVLAGEMAEQSDEE